MVKKADTLCFVLSCDPQDNINFYTMDFLIIIKIHIIIISSADTENFELSKTHKKYEHRVSISSNLTDLITKSLLK